MFGRDTRGGYQGGGGSYGNSPFGNNNYGGNNHNGGYNSSQKIGSYRVYNYDSSKISSALTSINHNWKEYTPNSINLREETLHLSPVEQRVEDYINIRKGWLEEKHKRALDTCITKNTFNKMLLDQRSVENLSLLPFSQ